MKKLIWLMITLVLLTGVLTGCTAPPAAGNTEMGAADKMAAAETGWPRTIKDALGKQITLKKKPERIVILDFGFMESMFALGIPPVASTYAVRTLKSFETLQPYAANVHVEELGEGRAPNLEKLVELQPDLILYTAEPVHLDMKLYERVSQIAPVVTFNDPDWKSQLREFAECLGEEAKAEAYIADIEALTASSREKLAGYSNKSVALLFEVSSNKGNFVITGSAENPIWFDKETGLGLTPPDGYPLEGETVSLEGLAEINPDYIFLFGSSGPETNGYRQTYLSEETQASSVWQSLSAVKNGHVYHLDAAVRAAGPLSIKLGIETVVRSMNS